MHLDPNRVAAILSGCLDPGGILSLPPKPAFPTPKVDYLTLPISGLPLVKLGSLLGLPVLVLVRELTALELFPPIKTHLDFSTARRLCRHLGVKVAAKA